MSNEASSGTGGGESVVDDVGRQRSSCGYCNSDRSSSISHGLLADSLTIFDYQDLLDRGWRRSGCYLYKPEMETTCCPAYTIRLRADDFNPSKEQLRVFRRMQRYLDGLRDGKKQELSDKPDFPQGHAHGEEGHSSRLESLGTREQKSKDEEMLDYFSEHMDEAIQSLVKSGAVPCDIDYPKSSVKEVSWTKKRRIVEGSENLKYTSSAAFQIAATLRRAKSDGKGVCLAESKECGSSEVGSFSDLSPKNLAQKLASALQHLVKAPQMLIKACNGHINFYCVVKEDHSTKESHQKALPSQSSTQEIRRGDVVPDKPQIKRRKLEILMNRSSFDPEEFALYRRYQSKVHSDEPEDVTESSYKRFLVDTPLIYIPPTGDDTVPPCGFGSFHQQYRIDGQLIAVGVIDILPKCLSSKYLFWDPDLAFLSLGKYSALQEISWVKEYERHCPSLQYYYLGYYIHSCPKMRYKAAYRPSELLCPLRYKWVPYDIAKPLLDRAPYAVLSEYNNTQNGALSSAQDPENVMEQKHNDLGDEDSDDADVYGYEEMVYPDSGSSDDELFPEPTGCAVVPTENADVGDLLLGLRETRMRYKELRQAIRPSAQAQLENQLSRYMKVVGQQLSERMVYSLV